MKIKCISNYRIDDSNIGNLQIFYNNSLTAKYARLRKYLGVDAKTHKPKFEYLKVEITKELQSLLISKLSLNQSNLDQTKPEQNNIDHKIINQALNLKKHSINPQVCLAFRARSLARIKASASGAENPGFKSQRARQAPYIKILFMITTLICTIFRGKEVNQVI